ncbi:AAA family ATPase [Mycolicibacterium vanbaalenii]|uniref:Uncharacterized protein n=1 Tax=Mycolicibacterium vanbaalenii (strain DSM 7251 / JCM 13017 / BCRC 16820 / KCTC 9966 / NRRL B-24157 / PYR-1) TaxID=350058 RepID=A1T824_MYCVP|nr:AAA family ATPase [Mycolicibacterium vanbaalenii]ABM13324.1 hypothetical protein Mvan_2513 [Mycolicibacterium vanbaalenii PYR-1]MCV7126833.1 AAA family ATPase [Mycolicibacterium vanbaalenii PYR-1]
MSDVDRSDEVVEMYAEDARREAALLNGHHPDDPGPVEPPDDDAQDDGDRPAGTGSEHATANGSNQQPPTSDTRQMIVTLGSAVTPRRIEWWEQDVVVKHAVNLLAAREGEGKSTVAASWTARETRSGGTVMWIGTEETREHAQVPRLIAAGADMGRVVFVDVQIEGLRGSVQFPLDLQRIEKVIEQYGVTMIVLDPCKGAVPRDFQGNDDVAVRQYLEPIAELCARCHVTLIGLVHFGKRESRDPGKLILGSVAWSQVARSVISIAEDPDTGNRVLTNTKANYSPHSRSIEFRIVSKMVDTDDGPSVLGAVEWIGDTDKDARNLLGEAGRAPDDELDERDYTEDFRSSWLCRYLEDAHNAGEDVRPKDAVAVGADKGVSRRSVFRLFDKLANAGMAESVEGKEFPRATYWRFIPDTTGTGDPHAEGNGTTGTTGAEQGKPAGTTRTLFEVVAPQGGTTAESTVNQGSNGRDVTVKAPVVPVVPPILNNTPQPPPGGITTQTPGMSDRVAAALAKAAQQTNHRAEVSGSGCTMAPKE